LLLQILDAPSEWQWLDPIAARVKQAVDVVLRPQSVRDVLHGKEIGHPAHPPLAQAALGGWSGAAVIGAAELIGSSVRGGSGTRERGLLGLVGLASAAPAVVAGLGDWSELHEDQQRTGLVHSAVMATAATLSVAARLARARRRSAWLDVAAGLVATVGAAVGGHLAYRWSAGANHAEAFPHLAKEGWTRVCLVEDLAGGELRAATVGDEPIVVGCQGGRIFALADRCSHLAGPLHEGQVTVVRGAQCLVCPWHGSAFSIDDGEVMAGPAYAPQPVLEVRTVLGWVDVRPVQLPGVAGR
jgi:nitrite reductase/ring-hydroxylating ferredoxin subunit